MEDVQMKENRQKIIGYIIIAIIISAGMVLSCYMGVNGLAEYKSKRNTIYIQGKSTQQITSDLIKWTGCFSVGAEDLKEGYKLLEADKEKVKNYLVGKGLKEEDLIFSSISTDEVYTTTQEGDKTVDVFSNYNLSQTVTINSQEVKKVEEISRSATDLLNEGIQFESHAPEYLYTKLADLKITIVADASKDATKRAQVIVENAGNKLGDLTDAGVSSIKIAPLYDNLNDTYDYDDYYDDYDYYNRHANKETSSLEKEITVVVYCTFEIK
jgi:hypothetical protein